METAPLYGLDEWLRRQVAEAGLIYIADGPCDTRVYLTPPVVGVPQTADGQPSKRCRRPRVLSEEKPIEVRHLAARSDTHWSRRRVRATE